MRGPPAKEDKSSTSRATQESAARFARLRSWFLLGDQPRQVLPSSSSSCRRFPPFDREVAMEAVSYLPSELFSRVTILLAMRN